MYSFVTNGGVNYICHLEDVTNLYAPILGAYDIKLIDFSFFPDQDAPPIDYSTGQILSNLLKERLADKMNVITYVCDESDGRQAQRQFKFRKWCDRYLPEYHHQPINIIFETENEAFHRYAGLLTHPDFPYDEELQHHLISKIAGIVAEKNTP